MRKIIFVCILISLVACVPMQTNTPTQAHRGEPLINKGIATKEIDQLNIVATPTQNILVTVGSWHLRQQASATGESIHIPSGTTIEIIMTVGNWYLIQTVEEDPLDVVGGYIHVSCCEVK